jgi:hypothetical protein
MLIRWSFWIWTAVLSVARIPRSRRQERIKVKGTAEILSLPSRTELKPKGFRNPITVIKDRTQQFGNGIFVHGQWHSHACIMLSSVKEKACSVEKQSYDTEKKKILLAFCCRHRYSDVQLQIFFYGGI